MLLYNINFFSDDEEKKKNNLKGNYPPVFKFRDDSGKLIKISSDEVNKLSFDEIRELDKIYTKYMTRRRKTC